MSLLNRNPRPLTRETSDYRDDKLFIVACDDTFAPHQYFGFFNLERVKIHVIPTQNGTSHAEHVLERLMSYECAEYDERWMLLDTDHCTKGNHVKSFRRALQDAQKKGVNIALSSSCFEVWLLLHHLDPNQLTHLATAAQTEQLLKHTLKSYNKTKLLENDFPLHTVVDACTRAVALDQPVKRQLIPNGVTSRVYKLWMAIINGASSQQLPKELLALKK